MAERMRPKQQVFEVGSLPTKRVGYYGEILEELKDLAAEGKGLLLEFETRGQGSNATKRLAAMADEDGFHVFQQLSPKGSGVARYVWAQKQEEESDEDHD